MSSHSNKPHVTPPAEAAAGLAAVKEVLKQSVTKPGLARAVVALTNTNQPDGFDCPGCAWPDSASKKHVDFCENGAKAIADEATRKRADASFFKHSPISALAGRTGQWLNDQGRITEPLVKRKDSDRYEAISWNEAFELIGQELNALDDPNEAAFYTSGRTSNEGAFLYQLFVRQFGTNNFPDCSNLCHESSGRGMTESIGTGKGTVHLEDFVLADAIFILGQNPGSNHPRMLATLQEAKRAGATIVTVNPLDETGLKRFKNPQEVSGLLGKGTKLNDLHVPVRVNGDVAFLKGLCKVMLEEELAVPGSALDTEFIDGFTEGFTEFAADIEHTPWASIEKASGVSRELIAEAAAIAINAENTICCWAMGLTQHKNAVANIQEVLNFLMLRGNLGKPGAGACPVRGHSNVQGDRTMGIWERPDAALLDALQTEFAFGPPREHGLDAIDTINAMHEGRVKVFVALGGNFMAATPDWPYTTQALESCRLTVQISTKLNRSHTVTGEQALILPALGRTEIDEQRGELQFVTVENSMGVVSRSEGKLKPISDEMRSELSIIAGMAEATLADSGAVKWSDLGSRYDHVRDHISRVIPGFNNFNRRIREAPRLVLPHAVRDERVFNTPSGKALFTVHDFDLPEFPEGHYLMMTIRSHDQFNTTVYSQNDRYRGIAGSRMVVFMAPADIKAAGFTDGQLLDISSHHKGKTRVMEGFRVVPYEIPRGCVATYYPESNPLIPLDHVADISNTPAYKSVEVSLKAAS
jgi:molybdopterin-dependent oxidoreductase alpha subunit